jgi:hypothetical protein
MTSFQVRTANLRTLNSATKYPSIPTYHELDPRNGGLLDQAVPFTGAVVLTEKIDGTNARIILLPDGTWILGSREELLYASGDLIGNPSQGIVEALRPVAAGLPTGGADEIRVLYVELYGGKVGAASKQYTTDPTRFGWRLFDVAVLTDYDEVLDWPTERISAWREGAGQPFLTEEGLAGTAARTGIHLTPRLATIDAAELPTGLDKMHAFLGERLSRTYVALDEQAGGGAEGIVLRTLDRTVIAKARFQDYQRTLKRRPRS